MASLCKKQQCTIGRRGFRHELDSWRHKFIHCVGFESILEGLFGPGLVEDLTLFKDCEPEGVSDWSFDENCLFCCLRRDKVKEHLVGLSNQGLESGAKPLLVKVQTKIDRLEKQTEEFLNAVLHRKDTPSFSDPHIPVVAREIMQRMIRQLAAEYTSKSSSSQDSPSTPQPPQDQSLQRLPSLSVVPPATSPGATVAASAHNQNPVLSKLLMADQDSPLDLTVKKPPFELCEQDRVLDLSLKKGCSSSLHSSQLSQTTPTLKGESLELSPAKARDLQSTSTLEQFMAKLCLHHQRQIVDALDFLQTEVKAVASSSTLRASKLPSIVDQGAICVSPASHLEISERARTEQRPLASTPKDLTKVRETASVLRSSRKTLPQIPWTAISLNSSDDAGLPLDLRKNGSGDTKALASLLCNTEDSESKRHSEHAPLKMKIIKSSSLADGKKLSCVLTTSLPARSGTLEEWPDNSDSSNRAETHSARLNSPMKRHDHSGHSHQARQKGSLGHTKDSPVKPYTVGRTPTTIPQVSPRTARKTIRGSSYHRSKDSSSVCRFVSDPDLGHCDIVYIDKPITECLRERHHPMLPRRNARKSTRGHMYMEEMWELKTVRTLAFKSIHNKRGNCPTPMPDLLTLVTPKQVLTKADCVPPMDMSFAGGCGETENVRQKIPPEQLTERAIPGTGDVVAAAAASEVDLIVETRQTDQSQCKEQTTILLSQTSPMENKQSALTDSEQPRQNILSEDKVDMVEPAAGDDVFSEGAGEVVIGMKPSEDNSTEEADPQCVSEEGPSSVSEPQQEPDPQTPTMKSTGDKEEVERADREERAHEQLVEHLLSEAQEPSEDSGKEVKTGIEVTTDKKNTEIQEIGRVEADSSPVDADIMPGEKIDTDVSSEKVGVVVKELPPGGEKQGIAQLQANKAVVSESESVIVGYVNGRPIGPSDRTLRRRPSKGTPEPTKTPVKCSQNVTETPDVPNPTVESIKSPLLKRPTKAVKPTENTPEFPQAQASLSKRPTKAMKSSVKPTENTREIPQALTSRHPTRTPVKTIQNMPDIRTLTKPSQSTSDTLPAPVSDQPVDSPRSPESKRPLRSSRLKLAGAVAFPANPTPPPTKLLSPLTFASPPLTVACPPLPVACPPLSAADQQNTVPQSTVELKVEKVQPATDTKPSEAQHINVESRVQTRQKLRSMEAKEVENVETQQTSSVVSTLTEVKKSEVQALSSPLRSKQPPMKEGEASKLASQEAAQAPTSVEDKTSTGDSSSSSISDKPVRMPLRSESSNTEVASQFVTMATPSTHVENVALRSQRSATTSVSTSIIAEKRREVASPIRVKPERIIKSPARESPLPIISPLPESSVTPLILPRLQPPVPTPPKFLVALNGEENQQLITNLNTRFDKMQKGWVQMDKECQPGPRHKNKADRQAAIWKSKRRVRKPKSLEHQRYSPAQMLFMKNFDLPTICRWFLRSTETKSLVIVKKVNMRLPSETQLCFHSSSGVPGTSHGVFPSLQAERLKKHLKKFAIASPVKSNPKSQKLIAKAFEQEVIRVKGKEKRELTTATRISTKPYCSSAEAQAQTGEAQKASVKAKNPASARILRKYSNIREKMQVQQTSMRLKEAPGESLKATNAKTSTIAETTSKPKQSLVQRQKLPLSANKRTKEPIVAKTEGEKLSPSRKTATKAAIQEMVAKNSSSSRTLRDLARKNYVSQQRSPQRHVTTKTQKDSPAPATVAKMDSNRKQVGAEKTGVEKPLVSKANEVKMQTKKPSQSRVTESKDAESVVAAPQQNMDVRIPVSPDQVLTRSQRKMEATLSPSVSPKSATKRAQEPIQTPDKRTRMSHSK